MKKIALVLGLLVAAAAAAEPAAPPSAVVLAQKDPAKGDKGGPGGPGLGEGRRGELKERVRQKIQTYVTVELASRAGLDEKKSLQLGNAIKTHMERRQQMRQQKKQELDKLKGLVEGKGSDAAIKTQMKTLTDLAGREEQVEALMKDLEKFLTPTETAKVIIALPEVMRETQRMVREARQKHRGERGHRGGGAMGLDLDD